MITRVESSFISNSPFNDIKNLLKYAPQLINKHQLDEIGKKITPDGVDKALREDFKKNNIELLRPKQLTSILT